MTPEAIVRRAFPSARVRSCERRGCLRYTVGVARTIVDPTGEWPTS